MAADPVAALRASLGDAIASLGVTPPSPPSFERPRRAEMGDYSTNAAMVSARQLSEQPREVASRLAENLRDAIGDQIERIEVAGPGFINVFLADRWHRDGVGAILGDERFGTAPGGGDRVLLEFVSANPTGPLTAASGRGAAYGDSLARVLEAAGNEVSREYYLNDVGSQIRAFAASIAAQIRGTDPPQDGYSGEYITELASELAAADPDDLDALAQAGIEAMRVRIEATLERFGVHFDTWFSERSLHERSEVVATVEALRARNHVYERDGAIWLRTSAFGDDKDRVLIRSDAEPTYFAADVAYHRNKLERGAGQMIVPLGADHHGYVPRMKAAIAALGVDPERYEAPIMQLVSIVEGGARARMSKRRGEFVTLDELIDDIGTDAARFFLLQRSHETAIDLDLELAREQSQENPVYYVQYAHARIASILRKASAANARGEAEIAAAAVAPEALVAACEPAEAELVKRLLELPAEIGSAAQMRAPHRLTTYATQVAADFHVFYRDCRVLGADAEAGTDGLEAARLGLCLATKRVIATALGLLGISAPERM